MIFLPSIIEWSFDDPGFYYQKPRWFLGYKGPQGVPATGSS